MRRLSGAKCLPGTNVLAQARVDDFDLYLTATMVDQGLRTVVTAIVKDFRPIAAVSGIDVVDLGTMTV